LPPDHNFHHIAVILPTGVASMTIHTPKIIGSSTNCFMIHVPAINTTRQTGGLLSGYKPLLPASA
jgi:hypothetical protein